MQSSQSQKSMRVYVACNVYLATITNALDKVKNTVTLKTYTQKLHIAKSHFLVLCITIWLYGVAKEMCRLLQKQIHTRRRYTRSV